MPAIPHQRWSCHSCSHCCRSLVIHLFDQDRKKIDRQKWAGRLGDAPYGRAGRAWVLNKKPDGACVFLDQNNRCMIHAEFGEEAKPLACRMFPFSVRPVRRGWRASLRFDCPSAAASQGKPLDSAQGWLTRSLTELVHRVPQEEDLSDLKRGLHATTAELDTVITGFTRWLANADMPMSRRLIGAARVTATLAEATLDKVRDKRFAELIGLLFSSAPAQCADPPPLPTKRHSAMLRQLVFAHAEHVSLTQMRSGVWGRLGKRCRQLGSAQRFLRGKGDVPRLPGVTRDVTFDAVETVVAAPELNADVQDMLLRYLLARLSSRSVFGEGYYGWPVFHGLTALWLSVAVVGWLTRYQAALQGRASVSLDDMGAAIGIVDRAATRLPALGTTAELARVRYLSNDDGVARLLWQYAPLSKT